MAAPSGVIPDQGSDIPDPQAANPPPGFTPQKVDWLDDQGQPHSATGYNPIPNATLAPLNPTDPTGEEARGTMPGGSPPTKQPSLGPTQKPEPGPSPSPTPAPTPAPASKSTNEITESDIESARKSDNKITESDIEDARKADSNTITEDDVKQASISDLSQLSKYDIKKKVVQENIPDEIAVPALMASAKAHAQNPLLTLGEQAEQTKEFLSGAAKGAGNLFSTGDNNPFAQMFEAARGAATETSKAILGPEHSYDSAQDLRGNLNSSGISPDEGEYQAKNALINQLSDIEKRLQVSQARGPSVIARQEGPMPGMSDQDRAALEQQRLALINQINPNYMKDRQLQANVNVQSGVLLGGATAARGIVNALVAAPSGIPGGRQAMDLYDANRSAADWKNELDQSRDEYNTLQKIAEGKMAPMIWGDRQINAPVGQPNQIPSVHDQLAAEGMPLDPKKIADTAGTFQLLTALGLGDFGIGDALGDAFASKLLGGASDLSKLAAKGGESLTGLGKLPIETLKNPLKNRVAAFEMAREMGETAMKFHNEGAEAGLADLGTKLGIPLASYAGGKVLTAIGNATGDFLGKAASDSFREGGFGANFLRRATATALNAPIHALPYAQISSDNPEQFGENWASMTGLNLGMGIPRAGFMAARNAAFDALFSGAKWKDTPYQDYGTNHGLDQNTQDILESGSVPKYQANAFNGTRDYFGPGTEIHLYTPEQSEEYLAQHAPGNGGVSARGFYVENPAPGQPQRIFVRSDSIPQALGWEAGRALHSQMPQPIRDQFNAAASAAINQTAPGGMNGFTQRTFSQLDGNKNPPASYPNFDALPTQAEVDAGTAQPGPRGYTKDTMLNQAGADAARRIFNGQSVDQLSKNPSILRTLRYGVGSLLQRMGIPTITGDRPTGFHVETGPDGTRRAVPNPATGFQDYINGVHPGLQASLIMERWMRQFPNRPTVEEVPSGAKPVGGQPPGGGVPSGGAAPPSPEPTEFRPSTEEQKLPPGITIPSSGGVQYRVDKAGNVLVKWNKPPNVAIPIGGAAPVSPPPPTGGTRPVPVPAQQEKQETAPQPVQVTEPTAGMPNREQAKTAPTLPRGQVYDRIMQSEGPGSQVLEEQGQHELYGFRDRDDPEAYRAIASARNKYGAGSPEETALVHEYLEKDANAAGMDKITNPGVQALVASIAHMRGPGGARAILQALYDGKLRENYGNLSDEAIAHINQMSPEQVIAHLRDVRERYDRVFYGDTHSGGTTWWNRFGNGLRSRYDREAQEALNFTNGDKDAYAKSLEASKGTTYAEAPSEGSGNRRPIGGDEEQTQRQAWRASFEQGAQLPQGESGLQTARQAMEERIGPNWIEHVPPEVAAAYAQAEPENYADQQRRLAALRTAQEIPTAREALGQQAPVLRTIQESGGFPSTRRLQQLGTFLEPNSENLAEAHAAFKALPSEQKLFLRQNYGITENKLFSNSGVPLATLHYELSNRSPVPFGSPQEILEHYYDTLSNLDRMHQGIKALQYGQFPEANVPQRTLQNRYSTITLPDGRQVLTLRQPSGSQLPVVSPVQGGLYEVVARHPSTQPGATPQEQLPQLFQGVYEARKDPQGTMLHLRERGLSDAPSRLLQTPEGNLVVPGASPGGPSYRALEHGNVSSLTPEKIQSLQSAAAESVPRNTPGGRARDTSSKGFQADVEKAQNEAILEAHAQTLPETDPRVQLYRDPDNPERLMASGTRIIPGDPVHDLLTRGISPEEIELANRFGQAAEGQQAQTMTYGAAERRSHEGDSRKVAQRELEQELSPAKERAAREAPAEDVTATWIPTRLSIGGLSEPGQKSILLHGLSTDKLTDNIRQIVQAAPEGYEGLSNLSHDDWSRAVGAYIDNQRHGYRGDGSAALRGTEKIKSQIDPNYRPQGMPKEIAQAINAALGDEGAKTKGPKGEAAREFAEKNLGYLSTEHEVNPLREKIRQEQGKDWRLGSAWETRRADLVREIHPSFTGGPGRIREGSEAITRAVEQHGQPRGEFVRAGFMPEEGEPGKDVENFMERARLEYAKRASRTAREDSKERQESGPYPANDSERMAGYRSAVRTGIDHSQFDSGEKATARVLDQISLEEKLLLRHAQANGELLRPSQSPPDAAGGEHDVWFDPSRNVVTKETNGYKYGYVPLPDSGMRYGTPSEYLDRLENNQKHFGKPSRIVGVVQRPGGDIRIRTEEPYYGEAEAVPTAELHQYLSERGFIPDPNIVDTWDRIDGLRISDAVPRNFVRDSDGNIVPVDLMSRQMPPRAAFIPEEAPSKESERFGRWVPSRQPQRPSYDISYAPGGSHINRNGVPISFHAAADEPEMMQIRKALQEGRMVVPEDLVDKARIANDRLNEAENDLREYNRTYNPVRTHPDAYARLDEARRKARDLHSIAMQANGSELSNGLRFASPRSPGGWESVAGGGESFAPEEEEQASTIPGNLPQSKINQLSQLWQSVSKGEEAFKHGVPKSGSLEDIAKNYSTEKLPITMTEQYGGNRIKISNPNGHITISGTNGDHPSITATEAESKGQKGGGGSSLYQAAFSWAAMNGKRIYSDALTSINKLRRTSNMLSSALRHESTDHLSPSGSQYLDWRSPSAGRSSFTHNVGEMARQEARTSFEKIPRLDDYSFDFYNGTFHDENGKPVKDSDIEQTIKARDPRFEQGVGLATAKRAIITKSALEGVSEEQGEPIESPLQPIGGSRPNLKGILYQPDIAEAVPGQQGRGILPISKMAARAPLPIMGTKHEREADR